MIKNENKRAIFLKRFFLVALSLAAAVLSACRGAPPPPRAEGGQINLENWDFSARGSIALDGNWDFFWNRLIPPEEFTAKAPPAPDALVSVPGLWNGLMVGGKALEGKGCATYRLRVKVSGRAGALGLKMLDAATSYRLWVNGIEIASNGAVSCSPGEARPRYLPMSVPLPENVLAREGGAGDLDFVVQVSNYRHRKGGLWESLRIGLYRDILEMRERGLALTFFLTGVIIIMGLYHLGLFILRRKEKATFYFTLLALFMGIRAMVINDRIFLHWFPGFPWGILVSLEYITAYCNIVLIALFLGALYRVELGRPLMKVVIGLGMAFGIVFALFDIGVYSMFKPAYDLYVLLGGGYAIYCLIMATLHRRGGAWLALGGMLALYLTGINDVLYNAQVINTTNLAPLGLFIYILSQSYLLAQRFARAMKSVENLSGELSDLNRNLEVKVLERTEELQAAFEEMEAMNDRLVETQNIILTELEIARRIQRQLIPQAVPEHFRVCAHYLPMEHVGGDFFDYIYFRERDCLGIFLSDVSGHGVPAALITSMMKSFLLQAGPRKESPAQLLGYLNESIMAYTGGNFITAFYCIYNKKTKKLVYSNAGHNPPILVEDGAVVHLDRVKSVPLGIMDAAELERRGKAFGEYEMHVGGGGRLFLYTDGLSDVQKYDDSSCYFGEEAMLDFITGNAHLHPSAFISDLMREIRVFQGRDFFQDDICVICLDL